VRVWIGLTDQSITTMLGSDNPVGNQVGFRFSTSAADTTVKCITKDGTTQNVQASATPDMTAVHTYELTEDAAAGRWHFFIDGNEVCGNGLTANLPTLNTNLRYVAAQQNLTASVRNIDIAWIQVISDR
jgi:hypothetical protein